MKAWESGVDGPTQKKSSLYSDLQDLKAEVQEVEQAVQPEHTREKTQSKRRDMLEFPQTVIEK